MAAIVQLVNKDGEKRWAFTVDAKEILAGKNDQGWKMTGQVKRSGWATPSPVRERVSAHLQKAKTVAGEVAESVTRVLAEYGILPRPEAPPAPEGLAAELEPAHDDVSAGLPPEESEEDGEPASIEDLG